MMALKRRQITIVAAKPEYVAPWKMSSKKAVFSSMPEANASSDDGSRVVTYGLFSEIQLTGYVPAYIA